MSSVLLPVDYNLTVTVIPKNFPPILCDEDSTVVWVGYSSCWLVHSNSKVASSQVIVLYAKNHLYNF